MTISKKALLIILLAITLGIGAGLRRANRTQTLLSQAQGTEAALRAEQAQRALHEREGDSHPPK